MTLPDITLTAHFAGGDADLSQHVRLSSWSVSRGSSAPSMTGLISDPGSFTATLSNRARDLDPAFTTGPYFGDLVPGVGMDLTATWAATPHPLFTGTNTKWPQIYPYQRVDQITQIECADAVRVLARAQLVDIFPRQLTGARIQAIVTASGWPGTFTGDGGTAYVPFFGDGQSASTAWSMMADACSAEWGLLIVANDGSLVFLDRVSAAAYAGTSVATFGDGGGTELPFTDVIVQFDDERIVNDADLLFDKFGTKAHAEDLTSQGAAWGKLSWQQNFLLSSGPLARSYVHEIVRRYKDPTIRIEQLVVKPQRDPDNLWPAVLSLELGQMISVKLTPMGGGARIERDCYIRHIQHDQNDGLWQTTLAVDDKPLSTIVAFMDDGHLMDGNTLMSF